MTGPIRLRLLVLSIALAGCGGDHTVGSTYSKGYLSTDNCAGVSTQKDCLAQTGCDWVEPKCPAGVPCPAGVCYAPDPCLGILDQVSCAKDSRCAWSDVSKLCPVGATCPGGGFCHPADPNGCACVTPIACAPNQPCPPPECDCNGGGSGGGTCTCACPACAPGEPCPPCKCDCGPGGGGSGCVSGGTCTCSCPTCPAGTTCPPCACGCGSGGAVPAPTTDPTTGTTMTTPDPCSKYTDQASCAGDTVDKCQWYALGIPCQVGQPCTSGVCQSPPTGGTGGGTGSGGTGGGCACGCPGCDPATGSCPPCQCDCGPSGGGDPGCVPPPMPGPTPTPTPTPCPGLGCAPNCPNGVLNDANGCPTCTCA